MDSKLLKFKEYLKKLELLHIKEFETYIELNFTDDDGEKYSLSFCRTGEIIIGMQSGSHILLGNKSAPIITKILNKWASI
jgi:hypothetical protein